MLLPPDPLAKLDQLDVLWTVPSVDAAGSMPIGNGEVVLNAWVEGQTGDLLFYIARTDALSEASRFLKLGRVRLHLTGDPLKAGDFSQRLRLREGQIRIRGGGADLVLFVDSNANVVHVTGSLAKPTTVSATLESWRKSARVIPRDEQRSAWSVHDAPFELVESADVFTNSGTGVEWYHRNETSVVPKLWENQSLTGLPGTFDPILHRTFGGRMQFSVDAKRTRADQLETAQSVKQFDLTIATACAQTKSVAEWQNLVDAEAKKSTMPAADMRTRKWWNAFWSRSWVFVEGDGGSQPVPANSHPLRKGIDSNGQNQFSGEISKWMWADQPNTLSGLNSEAPSREINFREGFSLWATITPTELKPGRIFDKLTAGTSDGFLFDTHPGDSLRLIVGDVILTAPKVLLAGRTYNVGATYDPRTGAAAIILDGKKIAETPIQYGSPVTRGYNLQRYVQACQGRGFYPIKFNGGYYTVEPAAMGMGWDADWRNWGDSHWFQNLRHMYHPMLAQGDTDMMEPFFRLYEATATLAQSRAKAYHGAQGVYFPETMTVFGTYSGGDYGWDRTGHEPKDVLCPWWQYAWNQGPELVALMLDRWDYTRDEAFLKRRVLPMAEQVLRYFDTRFKKDASGKIILDPTQVVETYWEGVINDMPSTAGLIAIASRLTALPSSLTSSSQKQFFNHMRAACPQIPIETRNGRKMLAPAQKYLEKVSNVENGELYAVWPFRVACLSSPDLLSEARVAYQNRKNHLDKGWGYDGNVAALLGLSEEAARILRIKCANSNPAYRWPATWGPNFDWLPDQNHGGNLLNTANLMLLQSDPIEQGGAIRLLPAWPKNWNVDFKLHAAANTIVRCRFENGKVVELEVQPKSRLKDIVMPQP